MKIFRLVLLALATVLFMINIWAIKFNDLLAEQSLWAYARMLYAAILIALLVRVIRFRSKKITKKNRK